MMDTQLTPPLYQSGSSPQFTNDPWFDSGTPEPPKKRPSKKTLLAILIATVIVGGMTYAIVTFMRQETSCLTTEDYVELTGEPYEGSLSPTEYFYDYSISFVAESAVYDDSEPPTMATTLQKISEFYTAHKDKPMIFSIVSYKTSDSGDFLAEERSDVVRASLLDASIPANRIVLTQHVLTPSTNEDEVGPNEDVNDISISITSATTCK